MQYDLVSSQSKEDNFDSTYPNHREPSGLLPG